MIEKAKRGENQNSKKERFEFILMLNDNIVCQRYFRINGFKWKSLYSNEFKEGFNRCVKMIKDDLNSKSRLFMWYMTPQIFEDEKEMRVKFNKNLKPQTYVVFRKSEDVYFWDGCKLEKCDGTSLNRGDFFNENCNEGDYVLKFSFLDNGKEVISEVWDANVYPRFVRSNIDLSNSKNRYDGSNGIFASFECLLVKLLTNSRQDLIPVIVKELCISCSYDNEDDYTITSEFGDRVYDNNTQKSWLEYVYSLEKKYKSKTDKYFKNLY